MPNKKNNRPNITGRFRTFKPKSAQQNIAFLGDKASITAGFDTSSTLEQKDARTWPESFRAMPPKPAVWEEESSATSQFNFITLRGWCGSHL